MKRLAAAMILLMCATCTFAQSPADEYGIRSDYRDTDGDYAPEVHTDTTLFYHNVRQADDLYARVAGSRLSFVQNRRRNISYWQTETLYAAIRLPAGCARALRAVGAVRRRLTAADASARGTVAGSEEYLFDGERRSSVGVTLSDRACTTRVRAALAARSRNGWIFDAAADARTGRDLHVDGVFTNAAGVSLRAAKSLGGESEISLFVTAEPSERGLRSASTAEAFALTGNNLYNPSWGWQQGRRRNSRVRRDLTPLAVLSFAGRAGGSTTLTASLAARIGREGCSSLGWYDAATPMPDNYRYLPGYFTSPQSAAAVEAAWRNGEQQYTQIDWERMYRINGMSDRGAVYALEERVRRIADLQAAVSFRSTFDEGLTVGYGIEASWSSQRNYRQMRDLLGARFLTDIDYYLVDDDTFGNSLQNDLRHPDRTIAEGDRFGYDYALRRRTASLFATVDYIGGGFDMRFAARVGGESDDRRGYFEKELFPGSGSYGPSERVNFTTYGAALTFGYTFSPKYRLEASLRTSARTPDIDELFLNPQYNNRTAGNTDAIKRHEAEITGRAATSAVRMQVSVFASAERGGVFTTQYYDDLAGTFCDMAVSGIDITTIGAEAAAEIRLARRWQLSASVTATQCRYASDPTVRIFADNDNSVIDPGSASHMGSCTPGGVPQLAASAAVGYHSPRGWSLGISAAWAGGRRVDPSMLRRTERVAYQGSSSPENFRAIISQERLPDAFNAEITLAKRWYMTDGRRITVSLAVSNLTGERNNIYSGSESHRVRRVSHGIGTEYVPLPTRYLYAMPRTLLLAATYSF